MTEWRDIPGYEGLYQVSDDGSVRSLILGDLLKPRLCNGYGNVQLYKDGVRDRQLVHRLVAFAFLAESHFAGAEVCHNDGDRGNNAVANLRWGTRSENILDSIKHGTHANHRKTHCKQGHPFDEANTYVSVTARSNGPQRNCRACNREVVRRRRAAERAKATA